MYAVLLSQEDVVVWQGEVKTPVRWLDIAKPLKIDWSAEPTELLRISIVRCELDQLESDARGYLVYYYPKI